MLKEKYKVKDINEIWDIIIDSIISSVYTSLLSQKIGVKIAATRKLNNNNEIQKDLKILGKICYKYAKKEGDSIVEKDKSQANTDISKLNSKYNFQIDEILEDY